LRGAADCLRGKTFAFTPMKTRQHAEQDGGTGETGLQPDMEERARRPGTREFEEQSKIKFTRCRADIRALLITENFQFGEKGSKAKKKRKGWKKLKYYTESSPQREAAQ